MGSARHDHDLITSEDLHDATDVVQATESEAAIGFEANAIQTFFDETIWDNHPQMGNVSLALGIFIGAVAARKVIDNGHSR